MQLFESINGKIGASERSARSLQRLAASRQSSGLQYLVERGRDTYLLLSAWNCPEQVCLAGFLSALIAQEDFQCDHCWLDFADAIGNDARSLAEVVREANPSPLALSPAFEARDSVICDIIAAQSLSLLECMPDVSFGEIQRTIGATSAGLSAEAYAYCVSSNALLGLPTDAHKAAREHLLRKILESPVHRSPCHHAFATDAFPETYYAAVLRLIPPLADFHPVTGALAYDHACQQVTGVSGQRHTLWLKDLRPSTPQSRNFEQDQNAEFWSSLAGSLADSCFVATLVDAFLDRSQDEVKVASRLVQETGVAYIAPHMDMSHKRLTLLFYLGPSSSDSILGTSLYELDEMSGCARMRKTLPFSPNSVLILPRTETSLHGVEPHKLEYSRVTLHSYLQSRSHQGTKDFLP